MIIFTDTVVVCNIHLYFPSDLLIGDANLAKLRGDILQLFLPDIGNKNLVELCWIVNIHLELAWISLVLHSMFVSYQRSEVEHMWTPDNTV